MKRKKEEGRREDWTETDGRIEVIENWEEGIAEFENMTNHINHLDDEWNAYEKHGDISNKKKWAYRNG